MNILYFNINHATNDPLGIQNFFNQYKNIVDVFCLQEISYNAEQNIDLILCDYNKHHVSKDLSELGKVNNSTYIHKKFQKFNFNVLNTNYNDVSPSILLNVQYGNLKYNILNYHGVYIPGSKLDTSYRIKASQLMINYINNTDGFKIIGGDFNLLPNTISINMFKQNNYQDLINNYNIKTTRNKNAWNLFPNNPQYYADYVFTCKNTQVKSFEVIQNEVSDHLPIFVKIY